MRVLLFGAAFAFLFIPSVAAQSESGEQLDVVKLKNGQEIVGKITAEDETTVTILFRGGELVLPKKRIVETVRAERKQVEADVKKAGPTLSRYEKREEFYYVYYRGKCVGWRQTLLEPVADGETWGYRFSHRTVYLADDQKPDLDVQVSEFVDQELFPRRATIAEVGQGTSEASSIEAVVEKGHMQLKYNRPDGWRKSEVIFPQQTNFLAPLVRKLADSTHFPEKGEEYKVFDVMDQRYKRVHAARALRKEIVSGKHQFVTVWKLTSGDRVWEIWVDGWGGIVREELGSAGMVAMRASAENVLAFSRGEKAPDGDADLSLSYENVPQQFRLERPNLTWSFEFPDDVGARALTLLNPTLQASVDLIVVDAIGRETESETVVLDVLRRMDRGAKEQTVAYQKPEKVGGIEGVLFEATADRKGVQVKTIGAVTVAGGRSYTLLCAAPLHRFNEALPSFERILKSFEVLETEKRPAASQ